MRARDFLLEGYDHAKTVVNYGDDIRKEVQRRSDRYGNLYMKGLADSRLRDRYMQNAGWQKQEGWSDVQSWKNYCTDQWVRILEEADPTPKKAFVRYLISWYLDGSMRYLEDASKATKGLTLYGKFQNRKLPPLNTIDFHRFLDLADELAGYLSQTDEAKAEQQEFIDSGQASLVMDNDQFKVIMPHTWEAAKFFGRGTRWCTSMEDSDDHFVHYNSDGPLYIILFKGQNKRWQWQPSSGQYMDAKDQELPDDEIEPVADILGPLIAKTDPRIALKMSHPVMDDVMQCIKLAASNFKNFAQKDRDIIHQLSREWQLNSVMRYKDNYTYCDYQDDDDFKWAVVKGQGFGKLQQIRNPDELMTDACIESNGMEIIFVKNPTDDQLLRAFRNSPPALSKLLSNSRMVDPNLRDNNIRKRVIELRDKIVENNKECLPLLPSPYCFAKDLQLLCLRKWGPGAANYIEAKNYEGKHEKKWLAFAKSQGTYDEFWPEVVALFKAMIDPLGGPKADWQEVAKKAA
jgi:hypothetical protein